VRPLLLLHPLGSSGRFWDFLGPLVGDRQLVAPDLPGHGSTPAPSRDDGVAGLAAAVVADLDARGIAAVDVVGVSLGGLVAQHLAAHEPGRVGRVVFADTVVRYPDPMVSMWAERAALARSTGLDGLVEPTLDIWFTPQFRESRPEVVARTTATLLATDPEGYARTCEILSDADLSGDLSLIDVPVLSVCGDQDGQPFRDAAAGPLADLSSYDVRWLVGRHAAMLETPAAFVALLEEFLRQAPEPVGHGGES
jgi:3-oxoadipate enol-lactonase